MNKIMTWMSGVFFLFAVQQAVTEEGEASPLPILHFQLVQQHGASCLGVASVGVEFSSCVYEDPLNEGQCYPRNRAVLRSCEEGKESQLWRYNPQTLQLHHKEYSSGMCLTRMVQTVEMLPCLSPVNSAQQWRFGDEGGLKSSADTVQSGSFLYLLEGSGELFFSLTYRFSPPAIEDSLCYLHPVTGERVCREAPIDPVTDDQGDSGEVDSGNREGESGSPPPDENEPDVVPAPVQPKPAPVQPEPAPAPEEPDDKNAEELKPVTPKYWLSDRLSPNLTLKLEKSNLCLSVMLPDGCLPVEGDEGSKSCLVWDQVDLQPCNGSGEQVWRHDLKTKKIYSLLSGDEYCLTWVDNKVKMLGCFVGNGSAQRWYFSRGGKQSVGQYGYFRSWIYGNRQPYHFMKGLTLPDELSPENARIKFRLAPIQNQECAYHPVTGAPLNCQ